MSSAHDMIGLGLMCKPPRPGATKTRLAAGIGHDAAARLSRAFLEDCADAALKAADACRLAPMAFHREPDATDDLGAILGPRWPLSHADSGELGATMRDALGELLRHCPAGAMVMGADVPLITSADISQAADGLRQGDDRTVVLMPTEDGGYCLIGVRSVEAAAPLLAPMIWSTPGVFRETLARAASADLTAKILPPQRDIDEAADLDWLREVLRTHPQACRFTRAALAELAMTDGDD